MSDGLQAASQCRSTDSWVCSCTNRPPNFITQRNAGTLEGWKAVKVTVCFLCLDFKSTPTHRCQYGCKRINPDPGNAKTLFRFFTDQMKVVAAFPYRFHVNCNYLQCNFVNGAAVFTYCQLDQWFHSSYFLACERQKSYLWRRLHPFLCKRLQKFTFMHCVVKKHTIFHHIQHIFYYFYKNESC